MNIDEGLTALVGATITGAALYEGDGDLVGVYSLQVRTVDGRDLELAFDTLRSQDMWIRKASGGD